VKECEEKASILIEEFLDNIWIWMAYNQLPSK